MKHDFLTRMREIFAHFLSKLNEDTCHYINGPETLPPADESGRTGGFSEHP